MATYCKRKCPACKKDMRMVTEVDGTILYKCYDFDCGTLILFDKEAGTELQRWNRNGKEY